MNKEWSNLNKQFQSNLSKDSFDDGIAYLLKLRNILWDYLMDVKNELRIEDYAKAPLIKSEGFDGRTVAHSIWHIYRIEDIVVNTLILDEEEVFFKKGYDKSIGSPIITTANEISKEDMESFSAKLDVSKLYMYAKDVKNKTEKYLGNIKYDDLKKRFNDSDRQRIIDLKVVSEDESAFWLIDYWCNKDVKGLLKMPLSRHWIMHIEAIARIRGKLS